MGEKSRKDILKLLSEQAYDVMITLVSTRKDLENLVQRKPDLVVLGVKSILADGKTGAEIWVGDYLEENGIRFTGSDSSAHVLESDKSLAKQRVLDSGLMTSEYIVLRKDETFDYANADFDYPLFVKPLDRGGGVGVDTFSVVHNIDQLQSKTLSITLELHADTLVENFLCGREFSVAVLLDEQTQEYHAMPIELLAPADVNGDKILSSSIKSADTETHQAVTDARLRKKLNELALDVFSALGGRDYGRIDIRLDAHGTPHFLEANLIPSILKDYGNFPKACLLNAGMSYQDIILQIVRMGLAHEQWSVLETSKLKIA